MSDSLFEAFLSSYDAAVFPHCFLGDFFQAEDFCAKFGRCVDFFLFEGECVVRFEGFNRFYDLVAEYDGFEERI